MRKIIVISSILGLSLSLYSQQKTITSTNIYRKLEKFAFLGKVMYVAAHPDDENTNVISYFANSVHATTAYLSLTRGDGGQNLIGPQLREALGVIRTQELLAARSIDGGEQWFTRANDFGYSKNPKETFTFWEREMLLNDVVWAFRKFKPDVIINRFDHRTPGTTHGHHTTSAMISVEAFEKSGNANFFSEQLKHIGTHQAKRVFLNKSSWFFKKKEDFEKSITKDIAVNTGSYLPILGKSNNEIAAASRSQHKCQGFGTLSSRGDRNEYFEFVKGTPIQSNFFEGIDTTWNRVKGGNKIAKNVKSLLSNFDFKNPSNSVNQLLELHKNISALKNSFWKKEKLPLLESIIINCLGLYIDTYTDVNQIEPSHKIDLNIEVINRSNHPVKIDTALLQSQQLIDNVTLKNNKVFTKKIKLKPLQLSFTSPYYLTEPHSSGMYTVKNELEIGLPEKESPFNILFNLEINGYTIPFYSAIRYKYKDRVNGEVHEPLFVVPSISVKPKKDLILFSAQSEKEITISLEANTKDQTGKLFVDVPENWIIQPESINFKISQGNKKSYTFKVIPPINSNFATAKITAQSEGKYYSSYAEKIDFPHIPKQQIIHNSEIKLINFKIKTGNKKILYIQGAGDSVDQNLLDLGLNITTVKAEDFYATDLKPFNVILLGIRALNKYSSLIKNKAKFYDFATKGGTVIVQYTTKPYRGGNSPTDEFLPYKFKLSRNRVTDEAAKVTFLAPEHKVLNTPNKITQDDFNNWVQERGLYFPDQWGKEFTPILGMNDVNEQQTKGSLLVSKYGEGYFVYTGISFFRELPNGVTGAYRLLVNIINL